MRHRGGAPWALSAVRVERTVATAPGVGPPTGGYDRIGNRAQRSRDGKIDTRGCVAGAGTTLAPSRSVVLGGKRSRRSRFPARRSRGVGATITVASAHRQVQAKGFKHPPKGSHGRIPHASLEVDEDARADAHEFRILRLRGESDRANPSAD